MYFLEPYVYSRLNWLQNTPVISDAHSLFGKAIPGNQSAIRLLHYPPISDEFSWLIYIMTYTFVRMNTTNSDIGSGYTRNLFKYEPRGHVTDYEIVGLMSRY